MVIIDPLDAYRTIIGILHSEEIKPSAGKNALYLSVKIFSIESYRDTIWRRDCHFTCTLTSKPCAGLAIGRTKAVLVPSFLSYFKTPSTSPAPRIETYDLHELILPSDDGLTL